MVAILRVDEMGTCRSIEPPTEMLKDQLDLRRPHFRWQPSHYLKQFSALAIEPVRSHDQHQDRPDCSNYTATSMFYLDAGQGIEHSPLAPAPLSLFGNKQTARVRSGRAPVNTGRSITLRQRS
jgi:hypothetical protein